MQGPAYANGRMFAMKKGLSITVRAAACVKHRCVLLNDVKYLRVNLKM
jgi:hypothetical protein